MTPLLFETSREDSVRIGSELGPAHEVWLCAAPNCGIRLDGRKGVNWFKQDRKYFCKTCYDVDSLRYYGSRKKAASAGSAAPSEQWFCDGDGCGRDLTGAKRNQDYFKSDHMFYCGGCYSA